MKREISDAPRRCSRRFAVPLAPILMTMVLLVPHAAVAQPVPAATAQPGQIILPVDLSAWGMFLGADSFVKAVLIGLALASVLTWTIWLAKTVELALARRLAHRALDLLLASGDIAEAGERIRPRGGAVAGMVEAAMTEIVASGPELDAAGIKERIALRLQRLESGEGRRMQRGTGVLATIGATAPFVGLLGTVWGIMNSFIGISRAQTTNLAVVAPGIAEALLATAVGLGAAIPAVIFYNVFARGIGAYRGLLGDAAAEVVRLVGRDLDRAARQGTDLHRDQTRQAAE